MNHSWHKGTPLDFCRLCGVGRGTEKTSSGKFYAVYSKLNRHGVRVRMRETGCSGILTDFAPPPPIPATKMSKPRKRGSGLNRYKNHPPKPRKPWHLVTDWTMPLPDIAALVGATVEGVKSHIRNHRS